MLVQQFHFTGWPDHGVLDPGYELPVLDFIFKSTAAQVEGAGPIVVHCRYVHPHPSPLIIACLHMTSWQPHF